MYTYAFLSNSEPPLELPAGMIGNLEIVSWRGLSALVEPGLSVEELQENDQRLVRAVLDHDRVIRDLFEQATVLPLRFGTSFLSRQALLDHLMVNQSSYGEKLSSLQGQAEYLLKFVPIAASDLSSPDDRSDLSQLKGKDYFQAKKRQYESQIEWLEEQQQELERLLPTIAQDYPQLIRGERNEADVERVYLLSDRQQEALLLERLQDWRSQTTRWELTLGERLPPYHFV